MKEEEEESITDAKNVTADTFSIIFRAQRENLNTIFVSEKLKSSNELFNSVARFDNMRINDVGYE